MIDITREQWDQLDSWARAQHVPLQVLVNTVFAAGLVIFERADARPDEVRSLLNAVRLGDERGNPSRLKAWISGEEA